MNSTSELGCAVTISVEIKGLAETTAAEVTMVSVIVDSENDSAVNDGEVNDCVANDGIMLDDRTTLVLVSSVVVGDRAEVGVISIVETALVSIALENSTLLSVILKDDVNSIVAVVVELTAALLITTSEVCKLIAEVSVTMVDRIIGGLDKGDTNEEILVNDILGMISLMISLVKSPPLPSRSELPTVDVTDSDTTELENIVKALILSSIPLPRPSLSLSLLSLSLLYCISGHFVAAELSFIL